MVISEFLGNGLIRHHSDSGKQLKQVETGVVYEEAIDVVPCKYTYEEFEESIEQQKEEF